jgi:hypothetical protein
MTSDLDADDDGIFTCVKVFSATKMRDRDALGDKLTAWIQEQRDFVMVDKVVRLSSDAKFHCLTITIFLPRVEIWNRCRASGSYTDT